ncbi:hypothetical protein [Auraticoccus monumenti]|uniref:Uncharacterized protein n=1 Tax=Auraticoccus monumenti TaxID=675864 RepID=A0A1G6RWS7_9ACTN|nr:hypothetical protein [Auraticoccus monumenti]SDD08893.1 hypothetical protein SAMN04489747_0138 [Auraticoccus monumenti]
MGISSLFKGAIKGAVVAKVLQVAERELRKPENQRKIKDGIKKLRGTRR